MSDQNDNESSVIKELRAQLKARDERLAALEPAARQHAFKEAGIDVSAGPGKFFAEKYDGDLTADAIREAAMPYGFISEKPAEGQAPASDGAQQNRIDTLRQASASQGGTRLSFSEWSQLSKDDPDAAMAAHADGRVDYPSHMAQHLAAPNGAA